MTVTDDHLKGIIDTLETMWDTCPDLQGVDLEFGPEETVLRDGSTVRLGRTLTINGEEFTLVLERYGD